MKNLIIIIGTVLLGVIIVNTLILGEGNSLKSAAEDVMERNRGNKLFSGLLRCCRGLNMKNLIIIMGTIVLGVFIFNMMVGDGENSLKNISRDVMMKTVENYRWEM